MDIRSMQYFLAVIREGTISAAAESLHVAQPSLSRQMKDLEEELGVTLFERGNRKITLTEEGQVLRRRAEEVVRLMQLTQEEIAQVKHRLHPHRRGRIAGVPVFCGNGGRPAQGAPGRSAAHHQRRHPGPDGRAGQRPDRLRTDLYRI